MIEMNTYGAIDLGTNSARLLIGRIEQNQLVPIKSQLITTRLGEKMWERPYLTEGAMQRTIAVLTEFNWELKRWGVEKIRAVATSAVRDSENKQDFIRLVRDRVGLEVEVISGAEEAKLGYQGVVWGAGGDEPIAVLDIGGGSTEFIFSRQNRIYAESYNLGAVRLTGSPMTSQEIRATVEPVARQIRDLPSNTLLIGVGGTITTAVAIREKLEVYERERVHGQKISLKEIESIYGRLAALSLEARYEVPGLSPQRADIIGAGLEILIGCMTAVDKDVIQASEADMLYGIINQLWLSDK